MLGRINWSGLFPRTSWVLGLFLGAASVGAQGEPGAAPGVLRGVFDANEFSVGEDAGTLRIEVGRPNSLVGEGSLDVRVTERTALQEVHFSLNDPVVTFDAEEDSVDLVIEVFDDGDVDTDRFFLLTLSDHAGASVEVTIWLEDNERGLIFDPSFPNASGGFVPLAVGPDGSVYAWHGGALVKTDVRGRVDSSFELEGFNPEPSPGAIEDIERIILTDDGELVVSGFYENYNSNLPVMYSWVRRYHSDGSQVAGYGRGRMDVTFATALGLQEDGGVVYAGDVENFQTGDATTRIGRLNAAGSRDSEFEDGRVFSSRNGGAITDLEIQSDGRILVAGRFSEFKQVEITSLVRLEADGTVDTDFESEFASGTSISDIEILPNGDVLVAGNLVLDDGEQYRLLRLDSRGDIDRGQALTVDQIGGNVRRLVIDRANDWLYLFGDFRWVYQEPREGLTRLTLGNWQLDSSFVGGGWERRHLNGMAQVLGGGSLLTRYGKIVPGLKDLQGAQFPAAGFTMREGDEGLSLIVERWGSTGEELQLELFSEVEGFDDDDYLSFPEVVVFGELETEAEIKLEVRDNGLVHAPTRLELSLASETGEALLDPQSRIAVAIADNEIPNRIDPGFRVEGEALVVDFEVLPSGGILVAREDSRESLRRLNADGSIDRSFSASEAFPREAQVNVLRVQEEGQILAGGWMMDERGLQRPSLMRLSTATGTPDPEFISPRMTPSNSSFGGLRVIELQDIEGETRILAGGGIQGAGRQEGLLRFHADGSADESFDLGRGFRSRLSSTRISSLRVSSGGDILVGGYFETVASQQVSSLALLQADGGLKPGFRSPFRSNEEVFAVEFDSEGRLLVAGRDQNYQGRLWRLLPNGQIDASFRVTAFQGNVWSIMPRPDGGMLLLGRFDAVAGVGYPGMCELQSDGNLDFGFVAGRGDGDFRAGQWMPDGSLLIAGAPSFIDEQRTRGIFRLLPSTEIQRTRVLFSPSSLMRGLSEDAGEEAVELELVRLGSTDDPLPVTLRVNPGSATYGSDFEFAGDPAGFEALSNEQRIGILAVDDGIVEPVESFKVEIIGVPTLGPLSVSEIAVYDDEIPAVLDLSYSMQPGPSAAPHHLVPLPEGKLLVVGGFTSYGSSEMRGVARVNPDGELDLDFQVPGQLDGVVRSALVMEDSILLGGDFRYTFEDDVKSDNLLWLGLDGSYDERSESLPRGNQWVEALFPAPDGGVFVMGSFQRLGASRRDRLAKLLPDGSLDESFEPPIGFSSVVHTLGLQQDGSLIVGGNFDRVGGRSTGALVRLLPDGSLDESFEAEVEGVVRDLIVLEDDSIVIAGALRRVNTSLRFGIAKLDSRGQLSEAFAGGVQSGGVSAMRRNGDELVIGGGFTLEGNEWESELAWLSLDGEVLRHYPESPNAQRLNLNDFVLDDQGVPIVAGNPGSLDGLPLSRLFKLQLENPERTTVNVISRELSVAEPDGEARVILGRIGNVSSASRIQISLSDISPEAEGNLELSSDVVEFAPLERRLEIPLRALDDNLSEQTGSAVFQIAGLSDGIAVGSSRGQIRVVDNDREGSLDSTFRPLIQRDDYYGYDWWGLGYSGRRGSYVGGLMNADVSHVEVQRNELILVAGNFCQINEVEIEGLARLTPEGELDLSYRPGLTMSSVGQMKLQSDDRLVVSDQSGRDELLYRLDANGRMDPSFHTIYRSERGYLSGFRLLPDDRLILWGRFDGWENIPDGTMVLLSPNGEVDPTFDQGEGFNREVSDIEYQEPGFLIVAGAFTHYDNDPARGLVRIGLDGQRDGSFAPLGGPNRSVYQVHLLANGRFQISGEFTSVDNVSKRSLATLSADGHLLDESEQLPAFYGTFPATNGLTYYGRYEYEEPRSMQPFSRLNDLGQLDVAFDPGIGLSGSVSDLDFLSNGDLILGGSIQLYDGIATSSVIRVHGPFSFSIAIIERDDRGVTRIEVQAREEHLYHLESSEDLVRWERRDTKAATSSRLVLIDETAAESRFYRVIEE